MSSLAGWLLLVAFGAAIALPVVLTLTRRRQRRNDDVVRRRLAELQALPAPDDLAHAPDLTKAARRHLRGRQHPIAHKRPGRPI